MSEDLIKEYEALSEIAGERKKLESKFRIGTYALVKHIPLMEVKQFYRCIEVLRKNLHSKKEAGYGYNMKSALHNARLDIFCSQEDKDWLCVPELNGEQNKKIFLYSFQQRWAEESRQLAKAVDSMSSKYRGEDAFGDYVDSLPLVGYYITRKILKGEYKNEDEIENDFNVYCAMKHTSDNVERVRADTQHMNKTIFEGENYFRSRIEELAEEYFISATMVLVE
jgi:hypothetical protein